MIVIDYKDKRPIYEQVIERIEQLILRGILKSDDMLPSVRSLAMELSINPNTIQRAYQELERLGFIYTVKGKGSFISDNQAVVTQRKEEIQQDVDQLVSKSVEVGIGENELIILIKGAFGRVKEEMK